jgi:hypothetical protein
MSATAIAAAPARNSASAIIRFRIGSLRVGSGGKMENVLSIDPWVEGDASRLHPAILVGDNNALRRVGMGNGARCHGLNSSGREHACTGDDEENSEAAG